MKRPAEPISKVDLAMDTPERGELFGGPAASIAVLTVERERLANETLFRETAIASLEWTVSMARTLMAEQFPPVIWLDAIAPEDAAYRIAGLQVIASEAFLQAELERIAEGPRPGHPDVQWSVLNKQETAARIVEIDERLAVLEIEIAKQEARDRIAAEQARLDRLERGDPTVTAVGDEDEADAKASA